MARPDMPTKTSGRLFALLMLVMIAMLNAHAWANPNTFAASSDKSSRAYIPNGFSNNVSVIDIASGTVIATIPVGNTPWGVAANPGATRVYITNSESKSVSVIDTLTNAVVATVPVGTKPQGISMGADGSIVYVSNFTDGTVSLIDASSNTVSATLKVGSGPYGTITSLTDGRVFVANSRDRTISVLGQSANGIAVVDTMEAGSNPWAMALTPDGARLVVTNYTGNTVDVFDTATLKKTGSISGFVNPGAASVNAAGTLAYIPNWTGGSVSIVDMTTLTLLTTFPTGQFAAGSAIDPNSPFGIYVANYGSNTVSVIDPITNAVRLQIPVGAGPLALGQFIFSVPTTLKPCDGSIKNQINAFIAGNANKKFSDALNVTYCLANFDTSSKYDIYIATLLPDRSTILWWYLPPGLLKTLTTTSSRTAFLQNTLIPDQNGTIIDLGALPASLPSGQYSFYVVSVLAGKDILNPFNWMSKGTATFTLGF